MSMFGVVQEYFLTLREKRYFVRPRLYSFVLMFIPVLLLGGCVSISSTGLTDKDTGKTTTSSFAYMLPTSVVPIQLSEINGQFVIDALPPKYFGDANYFYYGSYKSSIFSNDSVDVVIDSKGLLSSVIVTADDQTGQFLINLAKSLAAVQTGFGGRKEAGLVGATPVAQIDIDPEDPATLRAAEIALNSAARIRIRDGIVNNCGKSDAKLKENCHRYRQLQRSQFRIDLTARSPDIIKQASIPDCSIGVCFRLPIPYRISAGFAVGRQLSSSSVIVPLPNGGPIVATDFKRALFVKKVTNAGFTNGMLTSLKIQKPSEAAAVALLPATIVSAFFDTITSTFRSRQAALDAQSQYMTTFENLQNQRKEKETQLRSASLLSVGIGIAPRKAGGLSNNPDGKDKIGRGSGKAEDSQKGDGLVSPGCETPPNCK